MWGRMRDWLQAGAMLKDEKELVTELTSVEYGYGMRDGHDCILLEKKEDMKKRGPASPDNADALALTFAHPIGKADQRWKYGRPAQRESDEYDPLSWDKILGR
jgi:hypothetical protein